MTTEILLVFGLILVTVALFVSDRLRMDVVAILLIIALTVTGLLTPGEALAVWIALLDITQVPFAVESSSVSRFGHRDFLVRHAMVLEQHTNVVYASLRTENARQPPQRDSCVHGVHTCK